MAKGSGSDYENLEDDENVNENYCNDVVAGGDNEGNYNDADDEEYSR